DKSVPLFAETLKRRRDRLGEKHSATILAAINLGVNYFDAGRVKDSVAIFDEWLPRAQNALGTEDAITQFGFSAAFRTYEQVKQYAQVAKAWRGMVDSARKHCPADDPRLATDLAKIGLYFLKADQPAEAEPPLRESLAIREKKEPGVWTTFNTRSMLGAALLGQKKYAAAEPLLLAGYKGMKAREKTIPAQARVQLTEALLHLVQVYEALGQKENV